MRKETPDYGPYPRSYGRNRPASAAPLRSKGQQQATQLAAEGKKARPQSAVVSRRTTPQGRTAADVVLANAKPNRLRPQSAVAAKGGPTPNKPGARPQSAVLGSRVSTAESLDSQDQRVNYYRKQPVSKSRKCWSRINPGHMLEKWESTHRTQGNPKYSQKDYAFNKEFHLAKTDIMEYVNDMILMKVSVKNGFRNPV